MLGLQCPLRVCWAQRVDIAVIRQAIQAHRLRITDHTDEAAQADRLSFDEIYLSAIHGEIIEDYPADRPYPSCLIHGETFGGDPVHIVWAFNEDTGWAVLITVYRPDPERWIDWRRRRD